MEFSILDGLIYAVIGFAIVFLVLAFLILLAVIMRLFAPGARKAAKPAAPKAAQPAATQPAAPAAAQQDDDELAAVIAAALAMLDQTDAQAQQPQVPVRLPAGYKNAWRTRARLDNLQ